jgi:hypothetical protein
MPVHAENTFEESIEAHLLAHGGWAKGNPADYWRDLGLVPTTSSAPCRAPSRSSGTRGASSTARWPGCTSTAKPSSPPPSPARST